MRVAVVIPCPSDPDWSLFEDIDADIILVDDSDGRLSPPTGLATAVVPSVKAFGQRSAACRNAGHLWAFREGYETIIALDYDCRPREGWLDEHLAALNNRFVHAGVRAAWVNPLAGTGLYSRGLPYEHRDGEPATTVVAFGQLKVNMGLWDNVLDLNAIDRLALRLPIGAECPLNWLANPVAVGNIPVCGMNTAFRADLTPAYFFLPDVDVRGWPLSRHDDIWGGYILKKLMALRGDLFSFGAPVVEHTRLSNQENAIIREHWMHLLARGFFEIVDDAVARVKAGSYADMYGQFVDAFAAAVDWSNEPRHYCEVYRELHKPMVRWAKEFK